jgi:hypothetical protein
MIQKKAPKSLLFIKPTNNHQIINNDEYINNLQVYNTPIQKIVNPLPVTIPADIPIAKPDKIDPINQEPNEQTLTFIRNIKYAIAVIETGTITVDAIQNNHVFIVTKNITINSDPSLDGVQIVVFNGNFAGLIKIRGVDYPICSLRGQQCMKLLYMLFNNRWIIV